VQLEEPPLRSTSPSEVTPEVLRFNRSRFLSFSEEAVLSTLQEEPLSILGELLFPLPLLPLSNNSSVTSNNIHTPLNLLSSNTTSPLLSTFSVNFSSRLNKLNLLPSLLNTVDNFLEPTCSVTLPLFLLLLTLILVNSLNMVLPLNNLLGWVSSNKLLSINSSSNLNLSSTLSNNLGQTLDLPLNPLNLKRILLLSVLPLLLSPKPLLPFNNDQSLRSKLPRLW